MSRLMGFIHDQLERAGHRVDYLCADDVPSPLNRSGLDRFTFPLLLQRRVVAAARSGRAYDLVNVHEPRGALITTWRHAAGNPVVVVTSYGVEQRGWELALEERRLGRQGPSLKTRVLYPLTRLWQSRMALQRADHVLCSNFDDRDYLVSWLGLPRERITRIYSGVHPPFWTLARNRDYSRVRSLLFAATWRKEKGIEDLVPAFTRLSQHHPELRLVILGAGRPEEVVRASFPEPVRPRISWVQAADEEETAAAFAAADLFVLPSLFEGTPLTLIEGMMSGLPIVTTDRCGMKDVIRDGKTGLLVPVRSPAAIVAAVERLLAEPACRAALGRAAQAEARESYTWERVALPIRELYERLCDARWRPGI